MRFSHIGLPTTEPFPGEVRLRDLKMTVSDHAASRFGLQWQRYDPDAPYPELVKTMAHVELLTIDRAVARTAAAGE